ncbi:MAG: hypothetical protein ACYCYP_00160 [Leptospirales bacterium]
MALQVVPALRKVICSILLLFSTGTAIADDRNTGGFHVVGPLINTVKADEAVFWVVGNSRSLVHLWLDGNKVLARSLSGSGRVRLVLDHIPPGSHTVTFRLADKNQYEYGNEVDVQVYVPPPKGSPSNGQSGGKSGPR